MSTILIVEDEKSIVDLISFNLKREGYDILAAYDGGKGLELALSGRADLVLLDVMLPVMDGFEVLRRIRIIECSNDSFEIFINFFFINNCDN